jgi:hypothetical protein
MQLSCVPCEPGARQVLERGEGLGAVKDAPRVRGAPQLSCHQSLRAPRYLSIEGHRRHAELNLTPIMPRHFLAQLT